MIRIIILHHNDNLKRKVHNRFTALHIISYLPGERRKIIILRDDLMTVLLMYECIM